MQQVFKKCNIKRYIVYPEFDRRNRLHYHGTLYMTYRDRTAFLKCGKPKLEQVGFVDCTPTKQLMEWHCYCRKEWAYTPLVLEVDTPIVPDKMTEPIFTSIVSHEYDLSTEWYPIDPFFI